MSSSLSSWGRYPVFALLAAALVLPYAIVAHTYPVPTFYAEFTALALYLLMGAAVALCAREVASPTVALVPLAFALLLIVQTIVLPVSEPSMNWLGASCLLAAAMAAHAGYALARARLLDKTMCWAAYALLAGGLFAVFCQIVQLLHREAWFAPFVVEYSAKTLRRPYGNMAQANHLATYISFAMASALFLVQTRRLNVFVWALLSALYALGLALTVSRGPWLQMAVIVAAGFWMAAARHHHRVRPDAPANTSTSASTGTSTNAPTSTLDFIEATRRIATDAPSGTQKNAGANDARESVQPPSARRNAMPNATTNVAPDTAPGATPKFTQSDFFAWSIPVALIMLFIVVNIGVRAANLPFHLNLDDSAADRFRDAGQISPRLALWRYGLAMFHAHPLLGVGWGEFPRWQFALARTLGTVEIANNSHDIFIDLLAKTGLIGCALVVLGLLAWFVRALRAPGSAAQIFGFTLIGVLAMHALVEYPQQYLFFLLPAMFVFGLLDTRTLRFVPPHMSTVAYMCVVFVGIASLYPVFHDYTRAESLYTPLPQKKTPYGYSTSSPEKQYRAEPSRLFGAWDDYGLASLMPIDAIDLHAKLLAHERAIALLPGETVLRRYAVLQALSGNTDGALDTIASLKAFASADQSKKDWPIQLANLYALCDRQKTLATFKAELVSEYGPAAPIPVNRNGNDDDDDDSGN